MSLRPLRLLVLPLCCWVACFDDPGAIATSSTGAEDSSGSSLGQGTQSGSQTGGEGTAQPSTGTTGEGLDSGSSDSPRAVCGDEIVNGEEECDDGNAVNADGCNVDCRASGTLTAEVVFEARAALETLRRVRRSSGGALVAVGEAGGLPYAARLSDEDLQPTWTLSVDSLPAGASDGSLDALTMDAADQPVVAGRLSFDGTEPGDRPWIARCDAETGNVLGSHVEQTQYGAWHGIAATRTGFVVVGRLGADPTLSLQPSWVGNGGENPTGIERGVATDAFAVAGEVFVTGYTRSGTDPYQRFLGRAPQPWLTTVPSDAALHDYTGAVDGSASQLIAVGWRVVPVTGAPNATLTKYHRDDGDVILTLGDYGGPNDEGAAYRDVIVDGAGDLVIVGDVFTADGDNQALVRKLSPEGVERWVRTFAPTGYAGAILNGVTVDATDGITAVGAALDGSGAAQRFVVQLTP